MASLPCSQCSSSDGVEAYQDGDYCFVCNKKIGARRLSFDEPEKQQKNPKKINLIPLTHEWRRWLEDRGLEPGTIKHFNLQTEGATNSVVYPIEVYGCLQGYQLRDANKKIITIRYAAREETFLFEAPATTDDAVVVVEDPISAMRIWQDARVNVIALMGTSLTPANRLHIVSKYKKIIIWMDGDLAGYKAAQVIEKNCNTYLSTRIVFTQNDPKDLSKSEIKEIISTETMLSS